MEYKEIQGCQYLSVKKTLASIIRTSHKGDCWEESQSVVITQCGKNLGKVFEVLGDRENPTKETARKVFNGIEKARK